MLFFNRRKRYFFEYENDIHAHVLPGLDDGVKTMDGGRDDRETDGTSGIETIGRVRPTWLTRL